jgi:hypothetical protein
MSLNSAGSKPIISASFGGIDFGQCTLFFKENGSSFSSIISFDNASTSVFTFAIDPIKLLGSGKEISNLVGCQIGWTVTFIDLDNSTTSPFSFDLKIEQDSTNLMSPPYSKTDTITDTSSTFGGTFTFK